jgi:hypothetical protein
MTGVEHVFLDSFLPDQKSMITSQTIDFVLSYKRKKYKKGGKDQIDDLTDLQNFDDYDEDNDPIKSQRRKIYLQNLVTNGLYLEKVLLKFFFIYIYNL